MKSDSKILVLGATGLVGRSLSRLFARKKFTNFLAVGGRAPCDLTNRDKVSDLFSSTQPQYVFLCAARVGGIVANRNHGVEFFQDNIRIQSNVLEAAHRHGSKVLFLGSACAYPKFARNPIKESDLLTGELESTNECYALAKIAGIRLAQAYQKQYGDRFICAMPTNLYGPGDHYDLENSHVLPGVMRRIHEAVGAESVTLWGSGQPGREFLFVDDLAEACLFLMENYEAPDLVNVGTGDAIPLWRLAEFIANKVGFTGLVKWDTSKPDGTPWRCLDVTKINKLGWTARTKLWEGLGWTYDDYIKRIPHE